MLTIEESYGHPPAVSFENWFSTRYFSTARLLAVALGIEGYSATITTACSASTNAVGTARTLIALGSADVVVVCGADALSMTTLAGFVGLKATCAQPCAPFSLPSGMNLGEAGGCVVLESAAHAAARNKQPYAEILGYGSSNDAFHCSAPEPSGKGPARAMLAALEDAAVAPHSIAYVNAHGTGTEANDKTEDKALRRMFGDHAPALAISSTKSLTGHCLGAAGVVELIASVVAGRCGYYPPTANFTRRRDSCTLSYVGSGAEPWSGGALFMSNNLAFGGNNASIIASLEPAAPFVDDEAGALPELDPICISSTGVVSPAGIGAHLAGGGGFEQGVVAPFDMAAIDRRLDMRGLDRASVLGCVAARLALAQAGVGGRATERESIGLMLHCAHGPLWAEQEHVTSLLEHGFHIEKLAAFPFVVPNSVNGSMSRALGLSGFNMTFCFGPQAGLVGLPFALNVMRRGECGMVLSGAADELPPPSAPALSHYDPQGSAGAEGAAMVLLERQSSALARGHKPLATVAGWAFATVAEPGVSGAAMREVVQEACCMARIGVEQIGLVCALGGGAGERLYVEELKAQGWEGAVSMDCAQSHRAQSAQGLMGLCGRLAQPDNGLRDAKKYILSILESSAGYSISIILHIF
jgi:3-oxoacyl-[acyl-carrier-protein] synthase II